MKYLFLILLSANAYAECKNNIATSEVSDAIAMKPGIGGKACGKSDPCICFDGIDWRAASLQKGVLVNDPDRMAAAKAADEKKLSDKAAQDAVDQAALVPILSKIDLEVPLTPAEQAKALKILKNSGVLK